MDFQLSLQSETTQALYPDEPVAVETHERIDTVIELMKAQRVAAVLVTEADRLVGVFTERDVLRLLADRADLARPVREVMSSPPVTVTNACTVGDAIHRMSDGGYRHLPIVAADDPQTATGVVDVRGIVRYLVEHFPNTIYNLPPHPERATPEREGA